MRNEWYAGVVTALSSISHIGPDERGKQSVTSYFRREKVVQPDGMIEEVPVVSGNGMRGLLRDCGMWQMCRALGYGEEGGKVSGLSLEAFHFLFSGGTLTSTGARALDVGQARRIRELLPLVGLLGGAVGNQIMPGKLRVGKMLIICQETAHLLPTWCHTEPLLSFYDCVQQEAFTRKDDEKDERLRQMIAPETRKLIEASTVAKQRTKGTDAEKPDAEVGQHQQMRYFVETLAAGTPFFWELALEDVTDVEYDAFWSMMVAFAQKPYIGGKAGTGHGKVQIDFRNWLRIDPNLAETERLPDVPLGTRYETHLKEHGDAIREMLAKWD